MKRKYCIGNKYILSKRKIKTGEFAIVLSKEWSLNCIRAKYEK